MEVSGRLLPWSFYSHGKELPHPLDRKMGGPQGQSGHGGEEKKIPAPSLVFILTELLQLHMQRVSNQI